MSAFYILICFAWHTVINVWSFMLKEACCSGFPAKVVLDLYFEWYGLHCYPQLCRIDKVIYISHLVNIEIIHYKGSIRCWTLDYGTLKCSLISLELGWIDISWHNSGQMADGCRSGIWPRVNCTQTSQNKAVWIVLLWKSIADLYKCLFIIYTFFPLFLSCCCVVITPFWKMKEGKCHCEIKGFKRSHSVKLTAYF